MEDFKQKEISTKVDTKQDEVEGLIQLGAHNTKYVYDSPCPDLLEVFPNQYPNRNYITEFKFGEFTSLCPKTSQPDFATITIRYIPNEKCIETKSLKLYLLSYRQYGCFMETLTNRILEDLVSVCSPRWMKVISNFNARGGTFINVEVEYEAN
jgi:7-cyano-7-deazaguanine reductase